MVTEGGAEGRLPARLALLWSIEISILRDAISSFCRSHSACLQRSSNCQYPQRKRGLWWVQRSSNSRRDFLRSPFSNLRESMTRSRPCGACPASWLTPLTELTVLALPLNSMLSRRGTGDIIGTTPGDELPITGFNLQSQPEHTTQRNDRADKRVGYWGVGDLGELAPLIDLLLRLLARLGLRLGLRGVCEPGAVEGSGAGMPAASNLPRRLVSSRVSLFITASDSASSSCSIRILSARN
jgi:hypothetical protein